MDFVQVFIDGARAAIGVPAIVYALAGLGLNIQFGQAGLLNFGHVAFLLVGAYGTAIAVTLWSWPFFAAVGFGITMGIVLAMLLGIPTLRLRAEYLAIVTIAAAEILRIVVRSQSFESITGGPQGIGGFSGTFHDLNPISEGRYGVGDLTFNERALWVIIVGWVLVIAAVAFVSLLTRSPWGRVLRAIREDEDAARSLGKNVFAYKLQALAVGGGIAAVGGIVLSVSSDFVDPAFWRPIVTFFAYTIVILGGPGRVAGPVLGASLFWFVFQSFDTLLRQAVTDDSFAGRFITSTDLGNIRFATVGLVLVLLVVFRPQGLTGRREESFVDAS